MSWSDPKVLHEMASLPPAEGPSPEAISRAKERIAPLMRAASNMERDRPDLDIYIKCLRALNPIMEDILITDIGDPNECGIEKTVPYLAALAMIQSYMIGVHGDEEIQRALIRGTVQAFTSAVNDNPIIKGMLQTKVKPKRWWHRFWQPKTWTERSE